MSLRQSTLPVTPVVIDNGSIDETSDCVANRFPEAIWLPQKKNLGFGQANNVGIRYAIENSADYVLLLNQDATVKKDAIEQMCKVSNGESLVSPIQLNGDGTKLDFLFKYVLLKADNLLVDDMLLNGTANDHYENGQYAAACWLLPIAVVKKVGGFNPLFFQYSEDYNYLSRVQYHHIKVVLATRAFMFHDRNQHGSNKLFHKTELHREMLLAACDINKSFITRVISWSKIFLHCYTSKLPRLQYFPGSIMIECLWFLFHTRSILLSRKKEKTTEMCWLY